MFWASAQWREFVTLLTQGFAFLHLPFYVCLVFVFWDRFSYSPGWNWTFLCNPGWSCTYNSPALPPWCKDDRHAYHTHFYVELDSKARSARMLGKPSILSTAAPCSPPHLLLKTASHYTAQAGLKLTIHPSTGISGTCLWGGNSYLPTFLFPTILVKIRKKKMAHSTTPCLQDEGSFYIYCYRKLGPKPSAGNTHIVSKQNGRSWLFCCLEPMLHSSFSTRHSWLRTKVTECFRVGEPAHRDLKTGAISQVFVSPASHNHHPPTTWRTNLTFLNKNNFIILCGINTPPPRYVIYIFLVDIQPIQR